jgi:hypothetical protein
MIIIIAMFISAIVLDIYDENHKIVETCNITYQNNPKVNWQKFSEIRFEYKGNIYSATLFHSYVDLTQHKGQFFIFIDDEGKVYKTYFNGYVKDK